jgi:two-component system sensor kinase FixL
MVLSPTTVIWSMDATASLTIGLVHLLIWTKRPARRENLVFCIAAFSVAAIAAAELLMMRAQTTAEFGTVFRLLHIPVFTLTVSMVVFVRLHFRVGRLWLAYAVCLLRLLALILNFTVDPNLNFREITSLASVPLFGGESISVPVGVTSAWAIVGQASSILLLVFIGDAAITLWRRGNAFRPGVAALVMVFGLVIILAGVHGSLVNAGAVHGPYLISLAFLPIVGVMGYELVHDVVRAAQLADTVSQREKDLLASQQQLREERAFLRQVIDITPNLIFAKDRDSRFTLVNQAVADLYGTTVDALVGKTHSDLSANAEEIEQFRRVDLEVMNTRHEQFIAEEAITDAQGRVRWLQTVKRPLIDADGNANQILGSAVDITRRREVELEVAQQRNELAHLSRVTILGEMSGSLAHELNQPLTAILCNAQAAQRFLSRRDVDLDEVRAILTDIVSEDKRAGEIISGLRQLLKKDEARYQPLDLNDVVRDVMKLVRSDMLNSGVTAAVEFASPLPPVRGDRVQLQQVLLNLIVNGCDAMSDSPPGQRLLLVSTSAEGPVPAVTVVDKGRGVSPEDLQRIFEPFYTTKTKGLGLGLSVSRSIIEAHGGTLSTMPNATRGMRFQFTVPAEVA